MELLILWYWWTFQLLPQGITTYSEKKQKVRWPTVIFSTEYLSCPFGRGAIFLCLGWMSAPEGLFVLGVLGRYSFGCCCSITQPCLLCATLWPAACQTSLSFTISWSLLKFMSIESMMPSNHLILYWPLLLLPSIFPTIRDFSSQLALCIRWPKYWSFSFSISPSNEYSGLIFFRIDWFDPLADQGTLKSLLQDHSSKALVLQHSAFFVVYLIHQYIHTGKTIILTVWTFVGKLMSLLFNILSRFVIAFLPRNKRLLISWLHCLQCSFGWLIY